jgi:hypothetical protein
MSLLIYLKWIILHTYEKRRTWSFLFGCSGRSFRVGHSSNGRRRRRRRNGRPAVRRRGTASPRGVPPAEEEHRLRGARRRPSHEQQVRPRGREDFVPDGGAGGGAGGGPFNLDGGQFLVEEGAAAL